MDLDRYRNLASLIVVIGIGTESIVQKLANDKLLSSKDVVVLALPGEIAVDTGLPETFRVNQAFTWEGVQHWINEHFSDHKDIIRLAGADFIDDHELCAQAAEFRSRYLKRIHGILGDRAWALGNDINDTFMGVYHAAKNARTLLSVPTLGEIAGSFGPIPTISIGAGPSVKTHLDHLRALQEKCILVSCDAVYGGLVAEGIVPHFVCPQERLQQQAQLIQAAKGTRTIFAGLPVCHPDTVDVFDGRAIYLHCMDMLYDWLAPEEQMRCLAGSSTGVLSFFVAASLNRGPVYLVGHDLSYGETSSHWEGAGFSGKAFQKEANGSGGFGANGYEERMVPGNSGDLVRSITWWDIFRGEIAAQAALLPGRVFNVNAAHGVYARIENTQAGALPDPSGLAVLPDTSMRRFSGRPTRFDSFASRASRLPNDCDAFHASMRCLQADVRRMLGESPHTWNLTGFFEQLKADAGVSPGNAAAFQYFLRSAIFNEQAYMSYKARSFKTKEEAYFRTMRSLNALADAMMNAVEQLKPSLKEIADGERGESSDSPILASTSSLYRTA